MNGNELLTLAGRLAAREISADEFLRLAAQEMGQSEYATVDLARAQRCGFPEVIFGEGKSAEVIAQIAARMFASDQRVLVTRVDAAKATLLTAEIPDARYNETGRTLRIDPPGEPWRAIGHVAVITAGTSDLPVAEEARGTTISRS